jgi:hypothetical protein
MMSFVDVITEVGTSASAAAVWQILSSLRQSARKKRKKRKKRKEGARRHGLAYASASKPKPRAGRVGLASASASDITSFAVRLAGRKRPAVRDEWRAHLAGGRDRELSDRQRLSAALGFVVAAVRFRLQDLADLAWIPADAVLKSRPLSSLAIWTPTTAAIVTLFLHDGFYGVIEHAEAIGAIFAAFFGLIKAGRWWRGVKPADPKPRGADGE